MSLNKPDRTAFLHIGGPKTGSTAIQKALMGRKFADHHYIGVSSANHSPLLSLLFARDPAKSAPFFRRQGWDRAEMDRQKADWRAGLEQELAGTGKDPVFSAEIFCAPIFDKASLIDLRAFLQRYVSRIQVIGYVRSPVSHLQSAFQQRLKGDRPVSLDLAPVHYRKRFEKFEQVFGRENVQLAHYDRTTLEGGDVVLDFASRAGIELEGYERVETNTTLSLQAISVLYAQKKLGKRFTSYPGFDRDTIAFLQALGGLGDDRLRFGARLLEPVLDKGRADSDWIEERLGVTIVDAPDEGDGVISCEQDLLDVADRTFARLGEVLIGEIIGGAEGPVAVARLAEALRGVVSARRQG